VRLVEVARKTAMSVPVWVQQFSRARLEKKPLRLWGASRMKKLVPPLEEAVVVHVT